MCKPALDFRPWLNHHGLVYAPRDDTGYTSGRLFRSRDAILALPHHTTPHVPSVRFIPLLVEHSPKCGGH